MKKLSVALALMTVCSMSAQAVNNNDSNDWIFRIGAVQVSPNDDSGTVLGGGVGVDSSTGVGFSLTHMLDKNWGVEVLAALPFSHDIVGTGALSGVPLGETKQLPPTVSFIYQWGNETKFHVGAGINYTKFFEESSSSQLNAALNAQSKLKLDASTGAALKFGFDTPISNEWNFSGSVRYIKIDTTADIIVNNAVAASVDVDIDPWVVMLGVSTSF